MRARIQHPESVVVATPGRALDYINRGTLSLQGPETVVLDEADEVGRQARPAARSSRD